MNADRNAADPVLVSKLLLQLPVVLLDLIQVVSRHSDIFIFLADFRVVKLLRQGFYLHLQV